MPREEKSVVFQLCENIYTTFSSRFGGSVKQNNTFSLDVEKVRVFFSNIITRFCFCSISQRYEFRKKPDSIAIFRSSVC